MGDVREINKQKLFLHRDSEEKEEERIIDSVNKYNYGRVSYSYIKKQLKNLELGQAKKVLDKMNIDYNLDDSNNSIERDKEGENNNGESPTKATSNNDKKIISEEKLNMLIEKMNEKKLGYAIDEKKAQTNRATRLVMSELHTKTHFKALSCLSSKY